MGGEKQTIGGVIDPGQGWRVLDHKMHMKLKPRRDLYEKGRKTCLAVRLSEILVLLGKLDSSNLSLVARLYVA